MGISVQDINLREFPLFDDVDESAVRTFLSTGYTFSYKAGTPIVVNDDEGDTFFIILGGLAKIMLVNKEFKDPLNICLLKTGDFFGELTILENQPARTANVIALTDVEVAALQKAEFIKILDQYPQLGLNLAKVMGRRLRGMNERLVATMLPDVNRISRTLLFLAKQGKAFSQEGPILLPALPLGEWALFCNTERQQFMDILEKMRAQEIIDWQHQRIVIKDVVRLSDMGSTTEAVTL